MTAEVPAPRAMPPEGESWVPVNGPYDMAASLAELQRGPWDPTGKIGSGRVVRAWQSPAGPVTLELSAEPGGVRARAWGPGAAETVARADGMVGTPLPASIPLPAVTAERCTGPAEGPGHALVHRLWQRKPGLRLPRTGMVMDALIPAIIEQKVTGVEAWRSWRRLVGAFGAAAPGPYGLRLPPEPGVLGALPYHAFHRFGVERRRADTVRRTCRVAGQLAVLAEVAPELAVARLSALPGIGIWSANEVVRRSHGWADAVSVGDYHHACNVCWALAGERDGTDERMLELLERYRPYRAAVVRLVEAAGLGPGRRAPRARLRSIEDI